MKSQSPVGDFSGGSDDLGVLLSDVKRAGSSEEVEVEDTANDVVFERIAVGLGSEFDIHAVGIE